MKTRSNSPIESRWVKSVSTMSLAVGFVIGTPAQALSEDYQQPLPKPAQVCPGIWEDPCVTKGAGVYASIGAGGGILTSTNGIQWRTCQLNSRTFMRSVTCGHGLFVAVGGSYVDVPGVIFTSSDGLTWIPRKSGTRKNLYGVAYGNGIFVAVGDDGIVLQSVDGAHWTNMRLLQTGLLGAIACGNGRFVAVGESGTTVTSTDGIHWDNLSLGADLYFSKVKFTDGLFLATASDGSFGSSNGTMWALQNGGSNLIVRTETR